MRSVAFSPQAQPQYLLTVSPSSGEVFSFGVLCRRRLTFHQGGHEKKIRLFDLGRPEAEPLVLGSNPDGLSTEGNIKSLVWDEGQGGTVGVSASEDGSVR